MLILQHLYEPEMQIDNVSNANDSKLLQQILFSDSKDIYVKDAGTVFRFMLAYCATTPGEWTIRGTERLNERPIKELVDALKQLGADISYSETEGKAPLKIVGKELLADDTVLDLTQVKSSQFISALLLIAPKVKGDFDIKVNTKMSSYSYVVLTVSCLRRMGFKVHKQGQYINVSKSQKFDGEYFLVEPDWTSFYYWLSIAHLSKECKLFFPGLRLDNMQKERRYLFEVGNEAMSFEEKYGGLLIRKYELGEKECSDV
jgi:3-phosphoshikimate 1-carboxyvinyltransferase